MGPKLLRVFILFLVILASGMLRGQLVTTAGEPAQLDIRVAGEHSLRITLKPISYKENFPFTPALAERNYPRPVLSMRKIDKPVNKNIGKFLVKITNSPLRLSIYNADGKPVQVITFENNGSLSFTLNGKPVLGMGEGGPKPQRGVNWRELPVQFDRRGKLDSMQPRWQSDAYGSRNPVAMLIGTEGWGLFVATPWVLVDLQKEDRGLFIPWKADGITNLPQNQKNQGLNAGKGLPPIDKIVPGLFDLFVFDAHEPAQLMKDFATITGPSVMPPKWALGYMQSHRTLETKTK